MGTVFVPTQWVSPRGQKSVAHPTGLEVLKQACTEAGINQLTADEQVEPVPGVLEMIYYDDALDRLEGCNVGECLFQRY